MSIISEEEIKYRFSHHMRKAMDKKSISENELSKITLISQSAINRIRNGHVSPSLYQSLIIAHALENRLEELIGEVSEIKIQSDLTYIPVINSNNLLENEPARILGFIEDSKAYKNNVVGFKVNKSFDCKLLNSESIVISLIESGQIYGDGDTVLFLYNKKYMIGTFHQGFIKPIDNLVMKISLKNSILLGKVMNIETKYIKDKNLVSIILEKFNTSHFTDILNNINLAKQQLV